MLRSNLPPLFVSPNVYMLLYIAFPLFGTSLRPQTRNTQVFFVLLCNQKNLAILETPILHPEINKDNLCIKMFVNFFGFDFNSFSLNVFLQFFLYLVHFLSFFASFRNYTHMTHNEFLALHSILVNIETAINST